MREFVFRVWDKEKKVMHYFDFSSLHGYEGECNAVLTCHPFSEPGVVICSHKGGNQLLYPQQTPFEGINPNLIFMQYVRHKAIPDIKIFEDDVITCQDTTTLDKFMYIITDIEELPDFKMFTNVRVIGNTHEQPELEQKVDKFYEERQRRKR